MATTVPAAFTELRKRLELTDDQADIAETRAAALKDFFDANLPQT